MLKHCGSMIFSILTRGFSGAYEQNISFRVAVKGIGSRILSKTTTHLKDNF